MLALRSWAWWWPSCPFHGRGNENSLNLQKLRLISDAAVDRIIMLSERRYLRARSVSCLPTMHEFGLHERDVQSPALSTSYRRSDIPKPNSTVLEAQGKVCTGPRQTRPLTEEQAFKVLDTILRSAKGELQDENDVSMAQLGAYFGAMTVRENAFPEATRWSEGERHAINTFWPILVQMLPPDVIFLADPKGTILSSCSSIGPQFIGRSPNEMRLVGALRKVLAGDHLAYEDVQDILRNALHLHAGSDVSSEVSESLFSAFLIGQRMNGETDDELKAYCLALNDEHGSPVADVRSLTHYGEPYDGNTRYFRSTLFVAAVRASYGESCLLHGVDWMPPKVERFYVNTISLGGVTEEQMLKFMGAKTRLSTMQGKMLLEDESIGFVHISQREAHPPLYSLISLRDHIRKRPPLATSEKVQQLVRATGKEAIVAGFYHHGYENSLLMLMRGRHVDSGLVVKGVEGSLSMTTKQQPKNTKGLPVNYCSGFRASGFRNMFGTSSDSVSAVVNSQDYGFEPTDIPRIDRSVSKNIELGLAALRGEKGPAYDHIVLNAGLIDHFLGCHGADDVLVAISRAREAIDSGRALSRIMNYIKYSHKV